MGLNHFASYLFNRFIDNFTYAWWLFKKIHNTHVLYCNKMEKWSILTKATGRKWFINGLSVSFESFVRWGLPTFYTLLQYSTDLRNQS